MGGGELDEEARFTVELVATGDLNIPVANLCSSHSDDGEDLPATGTSHTLHVPAATLFSSDGSQDEGILTGMMLSTMKA